MNLRRFTKICDELSERTGRAVAWLIWIVMALCVYEIFTRRFFDSPHIWTYDVTNIFYGSHFMLLAAYTLLYRGHVSVDILYVRFSPRTQLFCNVVNYLFFFFPFMAVLLYVGIDSAAYSWGNWERTSIGLPIIYPILKTVTPATALLLFLQGLSEFLKMLFASARGEAV